MSDDNIFSNIFVWKARSQDVFNC